MRTLGLLLVVLSLAQSTSAQEPDAPEGAVIESVEVTGLDRQRLSPGLQQALAALANTPLDRARLDTLASRIEEERPEVIAAVRAIARPNGAARIVFLVARISDDVDLAENINTRYLVERVSVVGVPEDDVTPVLRDRMNALMGSRLDTAAADAVADALRLEFPGHSVTRRISRGRLRGRIRVLFELARLEPNWIRFAPSRGKIVFHEDQRWSGTIDLRMGGGDHRVGVGFAVSNADDLLEEYDGVNVRLESRRIGTRRFGFGIELSRYTQTWRDATLAAVAADPGIPAAYDRRVAIEPRLTAALSEEVSVFGGVNVTELRTRAASSTQMANAWILGIAAEKRLEVGRARPRLNAGYEVRAASTSLGSELSYTRQSGFASARIERSHSALLARFSFGHSRGAPPLFERFSLGDTTTLRGWSKYDVAPSGGTRLLHQSVEYRYRHLALFLDAGSVWDARHARRGRASTGVGFHADHAFVTFGFPLDADGAGATFMAGVRF